MQLMHIAYYVNSCATCLELVTCMQFSHLQNATFKNYENQSQKYLMVYVQQIHMFIKYVCITHISGHMYCTSMHVVKLTWSL